MRLSSHGQPHLTYCTNVHAGETWDEVRRNIATHVMAVKQLVAPGRFGVGLRLSARAAETLARPPELAAFRRFLDAHDLYVFTINGFPYGPFHGVPVKEQVYLPDWLDEARLTYTDRLACLLAELLPDEEGMAGTVSTVPGAFRPRVASERDVARMAEAMIRHVATLCRLWERTGRSISLAIEPEPCCRLETVAETVAFFQQHLFSTMAIRRLASLTGLAESAAEESLRRHLGVCFDACHMAIEFEEPRRALDAFRAAGIAIGKVQISAALKVELGPSRMEALEALRPFAEGVYLHQVVERGHGPLVRYLDLTQALDAARGGSGGDREWRIHFHVPIFRETLGPFSSTQDFLRELLGILRVDCRSSHLEVETYTWDVLPEEYRREGLVTAVARELAWVADQMTR